MCERGVGAVHGYLLMTMTSTPSRASATPAVPPAGPVPTTKTAALAAIFLSFIQSSLYWCQNLAKYLRWTFSAPRERTIRRLTTPPRLRGEETLSPRQLSAPTARFACVQDRRSRGHPESHGRSLERR